MKSPSQDLKQLEQKKQLEAEIHRLKLSSQSLNEQIANQQKQLKAERKSLLDISAQQLKQAEEDGRAALVALQIDIDEAHKQVTDAQKELKSVTSKRQNVISELDDRITTLQNVLNGMQQEKRFLGGELKTLSDGLEADQKKHQNLLETVAVLTDKKNVHEQTILTLENDISSLEDRKQSEETVFKEKKSRHEASISELEFRIQKLSDDILSKQQDFDETSDRLAKWEQRLNAQDENLRVREAQLDQNKRVLLRNQNLLRL